MLVAQLGPAQIVELEGIELRALEPDLGGELQVMVALIFFQVTAVIILLGAELNRGIMELIKSFTIIRNSIYSNV